MGEFSINARELHKTLNVSTRFNDWANRKIVKVFKEDVDYRVVKMKVANRTGWGGVGSQVEYFLTESAAMKIQEAYAGCFTVTKLGIREKAALDTIEQLLHVKLIRQYFVCDKYRIDGYDPINNIAYEIDEEQHFTSRHQVADRKREEEIRSELGCEFVRIKV